MSIRVLAAGIGAALIALTPGAATAAEPTHPTSTVDVGMALPPLAEVIGTESHTEMGEVNLTLARGLLDDIDVADGHADEPYNRGEHFGTWADPDGNGCDTRNDILARDLTSVARKAEDGCTVLSGQLADPYTGSTIDFTYGVGTSNAVQIDHIVALSYAWQHGAEDWTKDERIIFANDPDNLVAVDGPANAAKSDHGPGDWMPPNEAYRCTFSARYAYALAKHDLSATAADHAAMEAAFDDCPNAADEDGGLVEDEPTTPAPTPGATETSASPAPTATTSPETEPSDKATTETPESDESSTPAEEAPEVSPSLSVDPETITAERFGSVGGGVTISAEQLHPGHSYQLRVSHDEARVSPFTTDLTADESGRASFTVRARGQVFPGGYSVKFTGADTVLSGSFRVTGAETTADPTDDPGSDETAHRGGDELPYTGVSADVIGSAVAGFALIAAGVVALVIANRRAKRRD